MALTTVTVKGRKIRDHNLESINSETWGLGSEGILSFIPSISKKGTVTDGEVQTAITVQGGWQGNEVWYVTDTVATIAG